MTERLANRPVYVTDRWTTDDQLGFGDFCPALRDILLQADTPLTVGVFGPWGSGKTSLMRMLRDEIEGSPPSTRLRTVWFTAWKYDRDTALWRAFILRVLDGLYPRENEPRDHLRTDRPRLSNEKIIDPAQRAAVEHLDRLAETLYQPAEWEERGQLRVNPRQIIRDASNVALGIGLGPLHGMLQLEPDMTRWVSRQVQTHQMHQLFFMEQFENAFQKALQMMLGERGRLIVFVDDLDRCLPEKAIEVLEALKLFLEVPGTVFVLGMAPNIVEKGIEVRYGNAPGGRDRIADGLPIDGNEYLQKIVQIPFYLPSLGAEDLAQYLKYLDNGCAHENDMGMCSMTRKVFCRGVFPNLRQVKRTRNIFLLLQRIARQKEERGVLHEDDVAWPLLAKTLLIQTQWPELYHTWRQIPTLVRTLEEQYDDQPISEQEHILGRQRATEDEGGGQSTGGLLDEFLTQRSKYTLLERMLTYPKLDEAGNGRERARFRGLTRQQMEVYMRLAGTMEAAKPATMSTVESPKVSFKRLLSGDVAHIKDALEQILAGETKRAESARTLLQSQLLQAMSSPQHQALERVSAGRALAYLGDPRSEVMTIEGMQFCHVRPGPFWMGEDSSKHLNESLDYDYWIGRYPVTYAQFQQFVEDMAGYHDDKWWTDNGVESRGDRINPGAFGELFNLSNHPIVGVNWYEALAYTRWLTARLRSAETLPHGYQACLPSEAEWEKAARGGLTVPVDALPGPIGAKHVYTCVQNPLPERRYPWGNTLDTDSANYNYLSRSRVGTTSAAGCFYGRRSPYGCEDLIGNVWEWTRSLWGSNPKTPDFKYPYEAADGRENMNASIEILRVARGGGFDTLEKSLSCAFRDGLPPRFYGRHHGLRVAVSPVP